MASTSSTAGVDLYWLPLGTGGHSVYLNGKVFEAVAARTCLGPQLPAVPLRVRRWRDGVIPDVAEAVASPLRLSDDPDRARRILELVAQVPTPVWGRDELGAGEMWNSNSTISWVLACSGLDVGSIPLPPGGRAPGWRAGVVIAQRQRRELALHAGLHVSAVLHSYDTDTFLPPHK
jgi:hypothetical protein